MGLLKEEGVVELVGLGGATGRRCRCEGRGDGVGEIGIDISKQLDCELDP